MSSQGEAYSGLSPEGNWGHGGAVGWAAGPGAGRAPRGAQGIQPGVEEIQGRSMSRGFSEKGARGGSPSLPCFENPDTLLGGGRCWARRPHVGPSSSKP